MMGLIQRLVPFVLLLALVTVAAPVTAEESCEDAHCDWRSGLIDTDDKWSYTFETAHEYSYHCHPHPWMQASVTVEPAEEGHEPTTHAVTIREGDPDDTDTWEFFPAKLTIQAGDTVTWTNAGQSQHELMGSEGAEQEAAHAEAHDHGDHGHDTAAEASGPAFVALVALGLVAVAVARRR